MEITLKISYIHVVNCEGRPTPKKNDFLYLSPSPLLSLLAYSRKRTNRKCNLKTRLPLAQINWMMMLPVAHWYTSHTHRSTSPSHAAAPCKASTLFITMHDVKHIATQGHGMLPLWSFVLLGLSMCLRSASSTQLYWQWEFSSPHNYNSIVMVKNVYTLVN